jgi:site-specific DNA-adenine methylase
VITIQYMGSKARLSKDLIPIIQSYITDDTDMYIEFFVGGANVIDKIQHKNRVGYDINEYLIELLKYSQNNELPETISEEEYNKVKNNKQNYPKWYVGLVGFCGSFGAKWFNGFARRYNKDGTLFDVPKQAINSLRKQSTKEGFKNISFKHFNFLDVDISDIKNCVIYNDIPYRDTTKYKDNGFPYEEFYDWCLELSKNNIVLVSEYSIPRDEFKCIWEKEHYTSMGSGVNKKMNKNKIEKLFIVKGE